MGLKNAIKRVSVPAPAKINLFLAVTGKRQDGFHELVSVLAKLDLADLVTIDRVSEENHLSCKCVGADQLDGIHNLAEEAVLLWRKRTGIKDGLHLTIEKKIPVEAGLGGGSSDAVATLLALNAMMESPLKQNDLIDLSAQVGSDCPSFLIPGLCVAEGRGERVRSVAAPMNKHMKGKSVLLFKPPLGFSTAAIFQALGQTEKFSISSEVEQKLSNWESQNLATDKFLANDLELPVFEKHIYIPALFLEIEESFSLIPRLSGSGSCCFCLGNDRVPWSKVENVIRKAWGEETFLTRTHIV